MIIGRSSSRVRVRYAETDQMGVAYYANYFVWFEIGRTDWLRQGGWTYREMEHTGLGLPVLEAHCEYRRPALYDDEIDVRTDAALLSPIRVKFIYEVVRAGDGTALGGGHTVHAAIGKNGRPHRLPDQILALFPKTA